MVSFYRPKPITAAESLGLSFLRYSNKKLKKDRDVRQDAKILYSLLGLLLRLPAKCERLPKGLANVNRI